MGLLDGVLGTSMDDPRAMGVLALAGNMVHGNFGGGLLGYGSAYQGALDAALKRQDLAQQIGMRNIQLQQQQQEWAAIQPALAAYAARQAGQAPANSAPSQPAIPASSGGPLGSGTYGIPSGGQPATAPSATAGPSDPFGLDNVIQGRIINMMGGAPAAAAFWDRAKLPDAVKTNQFYGLNPADVRDAMDRENAAKGQTMVRSGSSITRTNRDGSVTPLFTSPDLKSGANLTWINGSPVAQQIPGLAEIQGNLSRATTAGAGSVTPFSGVDAAGNPLPVTNRTAAATQGGMLAQQPGDADRRAILTQEWGQAQTRLAGSQQALESAKTPQEQQDAQNAVTRSQADLDGLRKEMQRGMIPVPAASAQTAQQSGALYAAPPMGAVPAADASQKAPADSMKASYDRLQSTGTTANAALDALKKMQDLAAKKNPLLTIGPLGTHQSAINPDAAEYEKQRANVISLLAQQGGTNGTDAGRALTGESVPDFGKPKAAIADGLGTLQNQIVAGQIKRTFLTPIYQSGDSKKYTALENQFDQNVSPAMVPLLTMPAGPQRAAALKAAAQDPAMKARLNWAAENGLLQ